MIKILVVEDELRIQKAIKDFLILQGYYVEVASSAELAIKYFTSKKFDLILLDMMLPQMQGDEFLKYIRTFSNVAVIVISALSDEESQYNAYENHVDDYVLKPFSMNILNYKIKAIMRRLNVENNQIVDYMDLQLTVDNYVLEYNESKLDVTAKEFEIIQLLITHPGQVFSRDEIVTLVWGYDYVGDIRNVDVHIKNIRLKVPFKFIETVKGVGYRAKNI